MFMAGKSVDDYFRLTARGEWLAAANVAFLSGQLTPDEWARIVSDAYDRYGHDFS